MEIRKFLIKISGIFFYAITIFFVINYLFYKVGNPKRRVGFEIYDAIELTQQDNNYSTLILGDSVARQIFSPDYQEENGNVCYMATNQAIMTMGNYMLLSEYIRNNPQVKTVYYIARPDSIASKMNYSFTYSYFVTPLFNDRFIDYLDADTKEVVENKYGHLFSNREFPKWILNEYPKLLDLYLNLCSWIARVRYMCGDSTDENQYASIYLDNMRILCRKNDIDFHVFASPMPISDRKVTDEWMDSLSMLLEQEKEEYINSVLWIDNDEFSDGIHLKKNYLADKREIILLHYGIK